MAQQTPSQKDAASDAIYRLLSALRMNGQVCGTEWAIAVTPTTYVATVLLPEKTALEPIHHDRYVHQALEKLQAIGLGEPDCTIIEGMDGAGACECERRPGFILHTDYLSLESPLRCGSCFCPVPLYHIPPTIDEGYYDLICWASDYQACDSLQMNCRTLERTATRQLSRLDSSLSQAGLAICRRISEATQTPAYYYLYPCPARSLRQAQRRVCPSCKGEWLLSTPWHLFDFKCERCCLVSNIAWNVRQPDPK